MLKIKHRNTMNHCLFKAKDTKGAVGNTVDYSALTYYVQEILPESEKIKCNYCNKKFKGAIVYKQGKNNSMIKIHRPHYLLQRIIAEKFVGLCANCFHLTKLDFK